MIKYITYEEVWVNIPSSVLKGPRAKIRIPSCLATDGSTGFLVRDTCILASKVHDWLYCRKGRAEILYESDPSTIIEYTFTRKQADRFYCHLNTNIVGHVRYVVLRCFGGFFWVNAVPGSKYLCANDSMVLYTCKHHKVYRYDKGSSLIETGFKYYRV